MRAAIFDLDGTLADTSLDLLAAGNAPFETDLLDPERDRATAFLGARAMLRAALAQKDAPWDEETVERLYPQVLDAYQRGLCQKTELFPGVLDALDRLKQDGWALGVCTLKPAWLAEPLLEALGVRDYFGAVFGSDSLPYKKPDGRHLTDTIKEAGGDLRRGVLVGDSQTDRDTARNADLPSVLVTFRPAGLDVAAMEPAALLDHYDELNVVLDRVCPA